MPASQSIFFYVRLIIHCFFPGMWQSEELWVSRCVTDWHQDSHRDPIQDPAFLQARISYFPWNSHVPKRTMSKFTVCPAGCWAEKYIKNPSPEKIPSPPIQWSLIDGYPHYDLSHYPASYPDHQLLTGHWPSGSRIMVKYHIVCQHIIGWHVLL